MKAGLLGAVGASIWTVIVACSQTAPPVVLPMGLQTHLKNERFGIVTSIRGLPLGVRERLQTVFTSPTLDIAEPGAPFQAPGAVVDPTLKLRRLIVAGCSIDHCLVYYERGGTAHTWHAALFRWTPAATEFEGGGTAPSGLTSVGDVLNALLSGAVKISTNVW